jgi:alpha-glucosidase (family GH31 glycosyl hydrolase)
MTFNDKVVMEVRNESDSPKYEVQPILSGFYYEWTSKKIRQPGQYQLFYSDQEIPMFIKAGTALPLLQADDCFSLTLCYERPLTLQVYLDANQEASGLLYIDDGIT